jgi:hypothetical protein
MDLPLDITDKNFPKILSIKKEVMASVLTASVRVNDTSLRRNNNDRVGLLLEELNAADPLAALFA